jgi:hypothetical protein
MGAAPPGGKKKIPYTGFDSEAIKRNSVLAGSLFPFPGV